MKKGLPIRGRLHLQQGKTQMRDHVSSASGSTTISSSNLSKDILIKERGMISIPIEGPFKEKWVLAATDSPIDLVNFFEKRLQSLLTPLHQSADSLSNIEKYMMKGQERDEMLLEQTLLFDELQSQLTKLQIQCLEERRNYLGLVGDNEQLKLENEDLRRKFQAALLLGKIDEKAVTHFLQKNPKAPSLTDKIIQISGEIKKCDGDKKTKYQLQNPVVLEQQVAFLEKHLDDVKQQSYIEIYALTKNLKQAEEERNLMKCHYENRLKDLSSKLQEARSLIHKTAEENIVFQKNMIMSEGEWVKEQKKLAKKLSEVSNSFMSHPGIYGISDIEQNQSSHKHKDLPALQKQLIEKLSRSEIQLLDKQNILAEYEMKFIQMERRMHRIKEEEAETKRVCSESIKKLMMKNELLEKRFDKIDERRKLDNAGFREDVKAVRQLITTIEKKIQLFMYRKLQENVPSIPADENISSGNCGKSNERDIGGGGDATLTVSRNRIRNVLKSLNPEIQKHSTSKDLKHSSPDDAEKDRLIYEMICKVLDTAQTRVDKIERGLMANA